MNINQKRKKVYVVFDREFVRRKDLSDRALLIMFNLRIIAGLWGEVGTTVERIVKQIGLKPSSGKNGTNNKVVEILKNMVENDWISIEGDMSRHKGFINIILNDSFFFKRHKGFVRVTRQELDIITKQRTRCKKDTIVRVYTVLKSYKYGDNKCFPSIETLSEESGGKSSNTIINALKELKRIGLIYILNDGKYVTDDGQIKNHNNKYIFRLDEPNII